MRISDKKLEKIEAALFKNHSELNKLYPTRRLKAKTFVVDFHRLENGEKVGAGMVRDQALNRFEREIYERMAIDSGIEKIIFKLDFKVILDNMTAKQKVVLEKRLEGYTQEEIAKIMGISRKNLVKHLGLINKKINGVYLQYERN